MTDTNLVSITLGSTGCAAMVSLGPVGRPRSCHGEPTHAGYVDHAAGYPPRTRFRIFVCPLHTAHVLDARPMTDEDRAELAGRQIQEARALAGLKYDRVGPVDDNAVNESTQERPGHDA